MLTNYDVLLSEERIRTRVKELGAEITRDYNGEPILFIATLKGGCVFAVDLMREIDLPLELDFITLSSYNSSTESSGVIDIKNHREIIFEDRHVLIVDDIVDTGRTLSFLIKTMENKKAKSVKLCALLTKPERREVYAEPDYLGFIIPNEFVVGYGLDFDQKYRNLPFIAALRQE